MLFESQNVSERKDYADVKGDDPAISFIYEKGDYRNRQIVLSSCFELVEKFYARHFSSADLVLCNVKIEDNRITRYLGVWKILEKQFNSDFPDGKRSQIVKAKDGYLIFICKIEVSLKNLEAVRVVLDKWRNSALLYGDSAKDIEHWDGLFDVFENLQHYNPHTWHSFAAHLAARNIVGVRLFGLFDDDENGVITYEPASFFAANGEWSSR